MAAQRKKRSQHVRAAFAQIFPGISQETILIATSRSYAGSMARNQKAGNRPGHFPVLFHNDLCIFGFSRVESRSRLKRRSKGRFDRFSQFPGRKTLKHLDQSVHLGFAHAVQNCQAGRIRFGKSCRICRTREERPEPGTTCVHYSGNKSCFGRIRLSNCTVFRRGTSTVRFWLPKRWA